MFIMEKKIFVKFKKMTLSELRKQLKISRSQLGDALGVSEHTIKNWELGTREMTLNVNQIQVLSHLLKRINKTFDDLETDPRNRDKQDTPKPTLQKGLRHQLTV